MAELAKGFFFEKPKPGVPDFIKGRVSVKVPEAIEMLQAHQNNAGYVNLDLLESKDGEKMYFSINDWKPTPKDESQVAPEIDAEGIPF